MTPPLISVLITTGSSHHDFEKILHRIFNQTYRPIQVVIVSDTTVDAQSIKVLQSWQKLQDPDAVVLVANPQKTRTGSVGPYRLALRACHGSLIAFAGPDFEWDRHYLEEAAATLAAHPNLGAVFCRLNLAADTSRWLTPLGTIRRFLKNARVPKNRPFSFLKYLISGEGASITLDPFVMRRGDLEEILYLKTPAGLLSWWLLAHLSLKTDFYLIDRPLCRRIRHNRQPAKTLQGRFWRARTACFMRTLLRSLLSENQHVLDQKARHYNKAVLAGHLRRL